MEGDVSAIRDEDVLRRMWQQTEDFSRKKEIRAHMYRLRELRLRSLYSPDGDGVGEGKKDAPDAAAEDEWTVRHELLLAHAESRQQRDRDATESQRARDLADFSMQQRHLQRADRAGDPQLTQLTQRTSVQQIQLSTASERTSRTADRVQCTTQRQPRAGRGELSPDTDTLQYASAEQIQHSTVAPRIGDDVQRSSDMTQRQTHAAHERFCNLGQVERSSDAETLQRASAEQMTVSQRTRRTDDDVQHSPAPRAASPRPPVDEIDHCRNIVSDTLRHDSSTVQRTSSYHSQHTQQKISSEWSATQRAWASSLRADSRPRSPGDSSSGSRAGSPRRSASPDKRRGPGPGGSGGSLDRHRSTSPVKRNGSAPRDFDQENLPSEKHTQSPARSVPSQSPERKQHQYAPAGGAAPGQTARPPSPSKGSVKFIEEIDNQFDRSDRTNARHDTRVEATTRYENYTEYYKRASNEKDSPKSAERESPARHPAPSESAKRGSPTRHPATNNYGTYDKKRRSEETETTIDTRADRHEWASRRHDTGDFVRSDIASGQAEQRRHLVTPSTSPTRRPDRPTPHPAEASSPTRRPAGSSSPTRRPAEPSSRDSSPTDSVSDIVYFAAPPGGPVTDLDDLGPAAAPAPPPPPPSPPKESLPRKSSLKKSSFDAPLATGRAPPAAGLPPPAAGPPPDRARPPPLERRETYEERCRKILGMMADTATARERSPGVSPARSPSPRRADRTGTVAPETAEADCARRYSVTPSRESSPTKLHDIINIKSSTESHDWSASTVSGTPYWPSAAPDRAPEPSTLKPIESALHSETLSPTDGDRSLSPEKHIRPLSPEKHNILLSPEKHTRPLSPEKHNRPLSLEKHTRPLSPEKHNRHLSQEKHTRPVSPEKHNKPLSPEKHTRHLSPEKHNRPLSPKKNTRPLSPEKHNRPLSLEKHTRPLSPEKHNRPLSPEKHTRPLSPEKHNRPLSPEDNTRPLSTATEKNNKPLSPEKDTLPLSPEIHNTPLSPEKYTRPVSPEKHNRPLSPKKNTRPLSPEKHNRLLSPEKHTRPLSPEKHNRPLSLEKHTRPLSPEKHNRHLSPEKHTRPVSPENHNRPLSPEKHTRPVSPEKHNRPLSPEKHTRPLSPEKHTRHLSPEKHTRPVSPEKHNRPLSPEKHTRPKSPEKHNRPLSPEKHTRHLSPEKHARPVLSEKHNRPLSPEKHTRPVSPEKHNLSPEKHTRPLSPEKHTRPLSPEKHNRPLSPDKHTRPLSPEKHNRPLSPDKHTRPLSPEKHNRPLSPEKHTRPLSPEKYNWPLSSEKHNRSLSAVKTTIKTTDVTDIISTEREHEILNRVQQSLRRLSPAREHGSPGRDTPSPGDSPPALQPSPVLAAALTEEISTSTGVKKDEITSKVQETKQTKTQKVASKILPRNSSPTKKQPAPAQRPESPARAASPKKPAPVRAAQDRATKTATLTKQSSFTRSTAAKVTVKGRIAPTTPKSLAKTPHSPERRRDAPKANRENVSPKKDVSATAVTRTSSDNSMKVKKPSPQRVKSKPEIRVTDTSPGRGARGGQGRGGGVGAARSAGALHSRPEPDVLVQEARAASSREPSPGAPALAPLPPGAGDDDGVAPRLPDDVTEPDDAPRPPRAPTVDICDESDDVVIADTLHRVNESDECLLSVGDKVSMFTDKIETIRSAKDCTALFKETEKRVHSDFQRVPGLEEDDCLLTVGQKLSRLEAAQQGTPQQVAPHQVVPHQVTPQQVAPHQVVPHQVTPQQVAPHQVVPHQVTPQQVAPHQVVPHQVTPQQVAPHQVAPHQVVPHQVTPQQVAPHQVVPHQVTPQQVAPQQVAPQQKGPQQEAPRSETGGPRRPPPAQREQPASRERYEPLRSVVKDADVHHDSYAAEETVAVVKKTWECGEQKRTPAKKETVSTQVKSKNRSMQPKDLSVNVIKDTDDNRVSYTTEETVAVAEQTQGWEEQTHASPEEETVSTQLKYKGQSTKAKDVAKVKPAALGKITALRSSEAVRKAKALFESIATATGTGTAAHAPHTAAHISHTAAHTTYTTKLTDIGVVQRAEAPAPPASGSTSSPAPRHIGARKKSPVPVETRAESPLPQATVTISSKTTHLTHIENRTSPVRQTVEVTKSVLSRYPGARAADGPARAAVEPAPGYRRATETSRQHSARSPSPARRGSGTFGEERPQDRASRSSERRSSGLGPCIEDLYDVALLEQMLEKVVGYEQRRRIRAQIRVAKKRLEAEHSTNAHSKTCPAATPAAACSPDRAARKRAGKSASPAGNSASPAGKSTFSTPVHTKLNGHARSPPPPAPAHQSPRPQQQQRFNEYASAYMKKVGLATAETLEAKRKPDVRAVVENGTHKERERVETTYQTRTISKSFTERTSSREKMTAQTNGRRSPSPRKTARPQRGERSPERAGSRQGGGGGGALQQLTSGYGLGPLGADGRPLFGIQALRSRAADAARAAEPEPAAPPAPARPASRLHGLAALSRREPAPAPALTQDTGRLQLHTQSTEQSQCTERVTHSSSVQQMQETTSRTHTQQAAQARRQSGGGGGGGSEQRTMERRTVKSLTEKYIKNASDSARVERGGNYPKAGLILRSGSARDCLAPTAPAAPTAPTAPTAPAAPVSFLDCSDKVTGVQEIITRMKNADIVVTEGDTEAEREARALLNKFLGASALMAGMAGHMQPPQQKQQQQQQQQQTTQRCSEWRDPGECWDERVLRARLEECSDYDQRRQLRARLRTLMAEQEACAEAVSAALLPDTSDQRPPDTPQQPAGGAGAGEPAEEEVTPTSAAPASAPAPTVAAPAPAPAPAPARPSPFAKFRQLERQSSAGSPSPAAAAGPGSPAPLFKFTDPALQASAATIKERLLQWCRDKTRDYENVKLENFSTSWADGLAFCALLHHFLPDAFDYAALAPERRRHNFTLAFKIADEKAGIYPLLDVDDMVAMRKPDWKCVFTYVQSIHRRFKDQP